MRKRRAPDLTDKLVGSIVEVIDEWTGKLTWNLLIDKVAQRLGEEYRYSRFTLDEHVTIKQAFQLRQQASRADPTNGPRVPRDERLRLAFEQIERLKAKNKRLEAENADLLEQFHVWAINAQDAGVSMDRLNKPLAPPRRDQTKVQKVRRIDRV